MFLSSLVARAEICRKSHPKECTIRFSSSFYEELWNSTESKKHYFLKNDTTFYLPDSRWLRYQIPPLGSCHSCLTEMWMSALWNELCVQYGFIISKTLQMCSLSTLQAHRQAFLLYSLFVAVDYNSIRRYHHCSVGTDCRCIHRNITQWIHSPIPDSDLHYLCSSALL